MLGRKSTSWGSSESRMRGSTSSSSAEAKSSGSGDSSSELSALSSGGSIATRFCTRRISRRAAPRVSYQCCQAAPSAAGPSKPATAREASNIMEDWTSPSRRRRISLAAAAEFLRTRRSRMASPMRWQRGKRRLSSQPPKRREVRSTKAMGCDRCCAHARHSSGMDVQLDLGGGFDGFGRGGVGGGLGAPLFEPGDQRIDVLALRDRQRHLAVQRVEDVLGGELALAGR